MDDPVKLDYPTFVNARNRAYVKAIEKAYTKLATYEFYDMKFDSLHDLSKGHGLEFADRICEEMSQLMTRLNQYESRGTPIAYFITVSPRDIPRVVLEDLAVKLSDKVWVTDFAYSLEKYADKVKGRESTHHLHFLVRSNGKPMSQVRREVNAHFKKVQVNIDIKKVKTDHEVRFMRYIIKESEPNLGGCYVALFENLEKKIKKNNLSPSVEDALSP